MMFLHAGMHMNEAKLLSTYQSRSHVAARRSYKGFNEVIVSVHSSFPNRSDAKPSPISSMNIRSR
jgi:hypothetical protein